jgi:hypothetical protein
MRATPVGAGRSAGTIARAAAAPLVASPRGVQAIQRTAQPEPATEPPPAPPPAQGAAPDLDELADRVYELIVHRVAREGERRGMWS